MKKIYPISFSFFCILFFVTNFNLYAQEEVLEDSIFIPKIVYLNFPKIIPINRDYQADTIQFDEYIAYVFQKEFGDVYYKDEVKRGNMRSGLDLNLTLIKEIDSLLTEENILEADREFMQNFYRMEYSLRVDSAEVEQLEKEHWERFEKYSETIIREKKYAKLDRQYIGYINEKGEKIVRIYIIDYGEDPHNIKGKMRYCFPPQITSSSGNIFYPLVERYHYNLTTKKLTVNKDI